MVKAPSKETDQSVDSQSQPQAMPTNMDDVDMNEYPDGGIKLPPIEQRHEPRPQEISQTFVQVPSNEPINLDMSAFAKNQAQDEAMTTPIKSDTEIINECLQKHVTFS